MCKIYKFSYKHTVNPLKTAAQSVQGQGLYTVCSLVCSIRLHHSMVNTLCLNFNVIYQIFKVSEN